MVIDVIGVLPPNRRRMFRHWCTPICSGETALECQLQYDNQPVAALLREVMSREQVDSTPIK